MSTNQHKFRNNYNRIFPWFVKTILTVSFVWFSYVLTFKFFPFVLKDKAFLGNIIYYGLISALFVYLYLSRDVLKKSDASDKTKDNVSNCVNESANINSNIHPKQFANLQMNKTIKRLKEEILFLRKRANIQVTLGSGITIGAGIGLYFFVKESQSLLGTVEDIYTYFIPRLSLILFIEVFAFFFLKLYKDSLTEVKYYHNELTNIEHKLTALEASHYSSEMDISRIIENLTYTERNFILKKDETTVELEKNKQDISILKRIDEITSKLKP